MRVAVIGTSGSGKTTLAATLSRALGVRHIDLDAVTWLPGWVALHETDPEAFVGRAAGLMAEDAWVSCGNYVTSRPPLLARVTHLVWLDYDRAEVMARVIRRSFLRAVANAELWPGTGNREDFRRWLDAGHPIRWAWDTHARRRRQYEALFADPRLDGVRKLRLRRPKEAAAVVASLVAENAASANAEIFV